MLALPNYLTHGRRGGFGIAYAFRESGFQGGAGVGGVSSFSSIHPSISAWSAVSTGSTVVRIAPPLTYTAAPRVKAARRRRRHQSLPRYREGDRGCPSREGRRRR